MEKLKLVQEFEELQGKIMADKDHSLPTIIIPAGTCCQASGVNDLILVAKREILMRKLTDRVRLLITGCHGFCQMEPSVLVEPKGIFYPKIDMKQMKRIVDAVIHEEVLEDLLFKDPEKGTPIEKQADIPFFKSQVRTILHLNEKVDPLHISQYIGIGRYSALAKALRKGEPGWVIDEIKSSGLRGRGGAGFPTGLKWEFLAKQPNGRGKLLVCNADEGDPGAYMDRSILEGNPHSIIEGMIIGAYAAGATEGVIYVRNEYPLAIKHLLIALRQANEIGLLGDHILGTDFSFHIHMVRGAGAFVCGEETALIHSIEGKMGEPRQRPPFPVQKGIEGKPTAINNVETWANIPVIIGQGAREYSKIGVENNSGTKIFSLVGKVKYTGLVEVPMGTTIKEIAYDIGGGPISKRKIKAVQTGGPSGGCIPFDLFDLPIDYDSLTQAGSIMGSGGMIVMDEDTCIVDVVKYYMNFLKDESCGKCFSCRKGIQRMHEILDDVSQGTASMEHLDLLEELALVVKDASMCGLGQTAPNPVLSTLTYFRDEYEDHILEKHCKAGVCADLIEAKCINLCPLGQNVPGYLSLVGEGRYEEAVSLIYQTNPMPGVCGRVCAHPCMSVCLRQQTDEALSIPKIKRFATDMALKQGVAVSVEKAEPKEQKVAVIGGGPGGLAAAYHLALMGYEPIIFEELPKLGGMLRYGIPSYRLPRNILDQEIDFILRVGVEAKTGVKVGRDVTMDDIQGKHDAVFIAVGAHKNLPIGIPGENLEGVIGGTEFLRQMEQGVALEVGKRVAVIGGGNVAIDVSRTCRRMGADVTILYRRERKDMLADEEEIEDALAEGIEIRELVAPKGITRRKGRLSFEMDECELKDFDTSGRRRPVSIDGCVLTEDYDTIFSAIGQSPDLGFTTTLDLKRKTIKADRFSLATNLTGVFAGGDAVLGPAFIVDALAHGKRAARAIDQYLSRKRGEKPYAERLDKIKVTMKVPEEVVKQARAGIPKLAAEQRIKGFAEVELGFDEETAKRECSRCLRCDVKLD